MKKKIFLSTLWPFFYLFIQAQENKLTLQKCVETGMANNLLVQQSGFQMQTDQVNWKQARLNRLPDLNASAGNGINQGRSIDPFTNSYINQQVNFSSYGINSAVVLFNGFSLQNTAKQNQLIYEASKMDWQQAKDNLTINVILAYLQVLSNQDLLAQSLIQADLSKKQVERLEILNKDGAILPSLLSDLKGQFASDQLAMVNAENALESSKIVLCQWMNIPYDKNIGLERLTDGPFASKYDETPDNIYQTALQQFSLVKAVELRYKSAGKGLKVARGQLFPTLSLNGNANTNYSSAARNDIFLNTIPVTSNDYVVVNGNPAQVIKQQNNYRSDKISYGTQLNGNLFTSVSLNLRIPLFNSLQARNRIKLAQIALKNNEWVVKTTKTQLQQSIEQAYINMTTASGRYKILQDQVDAYTESFRSAEIRFNEGVGNSIDYLTAKNNLDRSTINLINARYDFVLRVKILDYYQGRQLW